MGYVICEWKKLKSQFPEFQESVAMLEQKTLAMVSQVWPGMNYGRFNPKEGQYGRTTILPFNFMDQAGDVLDLNHTVRWWGADSFRIWYDALTPTAAAIPGWKTILQGAGTGGLTLEDVVLNLIGFAFPGGALNISILRLEIGDTVHVKLDIEEAHMYEQPAFIFEDGYTIPEETYFRLIGWFEAIGYQRVVPLGFATYRRKDAMVHVA